MSNVYVAFYKGKVKKDADLKTRVAHIADFLIRVVTHSCYSHCEIAIGDEAVAGVFYCYSASMRDGGVRCKRMYLSNTRWDLVPVAESAEKIRTRFGRIQGCRYDWCGVFRFILRSLQQNPKKWFCSELCAALLGLDNPHQYSPKTLFEYLMEQRHA
ncbi:hypothetical protein [Dichelobacter nodosus]|uniref:hypothetical protein n=1 Tax=Dichelobacter nodosus TaxID=870 RepID=UPI000680643B|nr:hypothetical protein [Dichelobacter nodosus]KNZ39953.1 hypothetical protein AKG33_00980 [Dichelobacter nodosus]